MKPKVIAIAGPTASGKTKMAIDLAKQIDGEVISADSRYVYKGFNIASAKPTLEEMDGVPHHLIDIVEPEVDYSVADFYDDAKDAIYKILEHGKTPIVAGGTGLYFRVLLETYDLPRVEANPELRAELDMRAKEDLLKAGFVRVHENTAVIEINGKMIHMCHEPSKHNPNMFNLFGHVHDLAFIKPYGINVGVDVHHYRPVSYERMMYYANLTGDGYAEVTLPGVSYSQLKVKKIDSDTLLSVS